MVGEHLTQERTAQSGNADPIVEPLGGSTATLKTGPSSFLGVWAWTAVSSLTVRLAQPSVIAFFEIIT